MQIAHLFPQVVYRYDTIITAHNHRVATIIMYQLNSSPKLKRVYQSALSS